MKSVLTVAGSDSSGGAGIQADIKTICCNGVYASSCITSLTAQNTMGITAVMDVSPEFLKKQLEAVVCDIVPDAVKVGMVSSVSLQNAIEEVLRKYRLTNVVCDPVMISSTGHMLVSDECISNLTKKIFPLCTLVTPNISEAQSLSGVCITDKNGMEEAGKIISRRCGCSVLVKGGHSASNADDFLAFRDGETMWFRGNRIGNPNTHGTGCTLSSAIACNLAKGFSLVESIERGRKYIRGALEAGLDLGQGSGPLMHNFNIKDEYLEENV